MNARIILALACALAAGLATSTAVAMDARGAEMHRAEREQRQEQKQEQRQERDSRQDSRQGSGSEQRYANNPPPRVAPPNVAPPNVAPPNVAPPRGGQRDGGQRDGGQRGGDQRGGRGDGNHGNYGNGDRAVIGPPRGNDGHNARIVPPPRHYNPPGNGHSPRHAHPPRYVSSLPAGYHRHHWNGNPYYYHGGHWYQPYGSRYVVVTAPYGLYVPYLPYYSSFWFGSSRYFYSDGIYYNYEPVRRGYVVARSPYENEPGEEQDAVEDLYIYPAQGQSQQQQADDRYECHRWAVDQTQYDPIDSDYDAERRSDYVRAITACLVGRGYTVG